MLLFVLAATLSWCLSAGYVFLLRCLESAVGPIRLAESGLPEITVVIATLNEEKWIAQKLENLAATHYPLELITVIVVDGGSEDNTEALARACHPAGLTVKVVATPGGAGKARQINYAVQLVETDYVVCTDVDTLLDTDCIPELISSLLATPSVEVAGARVVPVTPLMEETVHWFLLNCIWWLEGRVFRSAGVSGACYAARTRSLRLGIESGAEDVELAQNNAFRCGGGTRIAWEAIAREKRVPQSIREWLLYRRFRGGNYRSIVTQKKQGGDDPPGPSFVHSVRRLQFTTLPYLAVATVGCGLALGLSGLWPPLLWLGLVLLLSALPLLLTVGKRYGYLRGGRAILNWMVLTCYVLLILNHQNQPPILLVGAARHIDPSQN